MTTQIYNMAANAASAFWMNPPMLIGLMGVALVIVTGLAGRVAIVCEDLRYARFFGRTR